MSIEEAIRISISNAECLEKDGFLNSASEARQLASWLQELKERREKESRGLNICKPYVTIQVDTDMMHRVIDQTIDNLYYECKNCGQRMIPQRKEESK